MRKLFKVFFTLIFMALIASPASAILVYSNDFSSSIGTEWSATSSVYPGQTPTINTAPISPNTKFLGTDLAPGNYGTPGNTTLTLNLASLPIHSTMSVTFDLYIIRSWDGNNTTFGPDYWTLSIQGGPTLLNTTFSNWTNQDYPANIPPGGNNPAQTGATAVDTLKYPDYFGTNSTYHLTYTFANSASGVAIDFQASSPVISGQGITDESWGLGNVNVDVSNAPLPATLLLLASGLLGLVGLRRFN